MPLYEATFHLIISTLQNATRLGRVLFFPEVSAYARTADKVERTLEAAVRGVVEELPLLEQHRRHVAGEPQLQEVLVQIAPPEHSPAWQTPVELRFHAVCWNHGDVAWIAYVPALDIEVVVESEENLQKLLSEHIRLALMRRKASTSLRELSWLQHRQSVSIETRSWLVEVPTGKQIADRQTQSRGSVLEAVGTDLRDLTGVEVFGLDDVIERLVDCVWGPSPQSVLLVGPSGVGKTAAVHKFAAMGHESPFWLTSGARLVAGMCGFGLWQERCQAVCKEAAETKSLVHLGNLSELMQVGTSIYNDQGIGDFLRPSIARGDFLAMAECTAEQLAIIERTNPSMVEAFTRLEVQEPSSEEGRRILEEAARHWAEPNGVEAGAIETLDRLHRRYATYSAYPGRPLRFLRNCLDDCRRLTASGVTAAFSRETGLPLALLEPSVRFDLDATRQWFSERVIGQEQAVETVVNLLATVKVQLSRPGRPIASLLFIGPTGVGKTEMVTVHAHGN